MSTSVELPEIATAAATTKLPAPVPAAPGEPPPEQGEQDAAGLFDLEGIVRGSPPWLISAVIHMLALIVFGLLFLVSELDLPLQLEARYAERLGEFEDIADLDLPVTDQDIEIEDIVQPTELPIVNDPLSAPPVAPIDPRGATMTSPQAPTAIGMALTGREPGMKQALTLAYGGNALTQKAVEEGLNWLARNQQKDGSWSLRGPYRDGGSSENRQAATAMALLAFQGDGHTHQPIGNDKYSGVVRRGWQWLLKTQNSDGYFKGDVPYNHQLYTHAQCTIAICELYGMTRDEDFREPAQRAIDFAVKIQTEKGGWRYYPETDEDLSVTGWFAMALQSARMAGLFVPSETFDRLSRYPRHRTEGKRQSIRLSSQRGSAPQHDGRGPTMSAIPRLGSRRSAAARWCRPHS